MAQPTNAWLNHLLHAPSVEQLVQRLSQSPQKRLVAQGSQGSSAALLAGAIAIRTQQPVLLVVAHLDDADHAIEDLALWSQAGHPLERHSFGALEVLPGETNTSLELLAERLALVQKLNGAHNFDHSVIVTPIAALMQAVPLPAAMAQLALTLKVGDEYSPGNLATWLTDAGYQRIEGIEQPGDFSIRGGIVDIYPPTGTNEDPIRLDYFGDEIESICGVDPNTLGSGTRLKQIQLISAKLEGLQNDDQTTSLWSLLPDNIAVVMHEVMELSEQARGYFERLTNPVGIYSPGAVFRALTARPHIEVNQYSSTSKEDRAITLPIGSLAPFAQQASDAVKELGELCEDPTRQVNVLCSQRAEHDRLIALIEEHIKPACPNLHVCVGYLHRGFRWQTDEGELALIPHQELFHRYDLRTSIRRLGSTHTAASRATDAFLDLSPGDYVVHADHGVAIFRGLRYMKPKKAPPGSTPGKTTGKSPTHSKIPGKKTSGGGEEFLTLEFASRVLVHVPVSQIDRVSRYIGGFEGKPSLSKVGGKRWDKQKEQVQEAVKDMAGELLRVQAARAAMPGICFPSDTPWQTEFEAAFPYEETEDQLVAIASTKKDMATNRPMDRLICGDVGFGKTEVAIRAAFKAAQHGKQVAVLVPTTVLAEQHERTFRSRMADYPVRIEALSRFKTTGQQK